LPEQDFHPLELSTLLGRTPLLFRRMEKRSAFRHRAGIHFQVIMYDHFGQRRD